MTHNIACPCGFHTSGNRGAIIGSMRQHAERFHGVALSPETVLAMARPVPSNTAGLVLDLLVQALHAWTDSSATAPSSGGSRANQTGVAPKPEPALPPAGVTPIASIDLSTRGFMESERLGEYWITLQVDNMRSCLLSVSGPLDYKGYYDLTLMANDQPTALVDDEHNLVPVTVTRLQHPRNYSLVRLQVWPSALGWLPRISPYMRNPFK